MKSLISDKKECYVCKTIFNLHKHHIFFGANRKKSDQDGCWVYLCANHHNMSDKGVHFDKKLDLFLKKLCEKKWCEYYKKTKEDFLKKYKRNYL